MLGDIQKAIKIDPSCLWPECGRCQGLRDDSGSLNVRWHRQERLQVEDGIVLNLDLPNMYWLVGNEKNSGETVCETFGMDGHWGAQFGFSK